MAAGAHLGKKKAGLGLAKSEEKLGEVVISSKLGAALKGSLAIRYLSRMGTASQDQSILRKKAVVTQRRGSF